MTRRAGGGAPEPPARKEAGAWRHGDLRRAALAAAERHLLATGAPDFTLRSLAAGLGVTHPALLKHFPSRESLMEAVAIRGFERLLADLQAVAGGGGAPSTVCVALCRTLIGFAREQPALYRVMFGEAVIRRKVPGGPLATALEAPLALAAEVVARAQAGGAIGDGDPRMLAATMWAAAHGVATLVIDQRLGILGDDPAAAEQLIGLTLDAVSKGLAP